MHLILSHHKKSWWFLWLLLDCGAQRTKQKLAPAWVLLSYFFNVMQTRSFNGPLSLKRWKGKALWVLEIVLEKEKKKAALWSSSVLWRNLGETWKKTRRVLQRHLMMPNPLNSAVWGFFPPTLREIHRARSRCGGQRRLGGRERRALQWSALNWSSVSQVWFSVNRAWSPRKRRLT